jgi:Mn2+/Fe2+ NRAMP family transporter
MGKRTSITTFVTTVLITLITIMLILTMKHDHTTNIIEAVVLMIGLFVFAGFMIRSAEISAKKKDYINL